jgi:hypothetical protein
MCLQIANQYIFNDCWIYRTSPYLTVEKLNISDGRSFTRIFGCRNCATLEPAMLKRDVRVSPTRVSVMKTPEILTIIYCIHGNFENHNGLL